MQTKLIKLKKLVRYIMPCQALMLLHGDINFLNKFSSRTVKIISAKYIKDCKNDDTGSSSLLKKLCTFSKEKLILVYHHNLFLILKQTTDFRTFCLVKIFWPSPRLILSCIRKEAFTFPHKFSIWSALCYW